MKKKALQEGFEKLEEDRREEYKILVRKQQEQNLELQKLHMALQKKNKSPLKKQNTLL